MTGKMKAIRVHEFGGPSVLRCEELPVPDVGTDQVLVQVHAAGVNPVDTYIRSGTYALKPPLPYTPGTDAAGVVAAIGAGVTHLAVGDRVYTAGALTGAYADFALCRGDQVYPLPDNCGFDGGAALGVPAATAFRALFQKGHARAGEKLLVHGATGSVGLAAVQLALAAGLKVYATGGSNEGRLQLAGLGAEAVFDHHAADHVTQLRQQSGGVDLVLEMLGNVNLENDLQLLSSNGRVVIIGNRGRTEIDPRLIMQKEAVVTGVMLFAATPAELAEIHAGLYRHLANGSLTPVIARGFALDDAALAHEAVLQSHVGKLVLTPTAGLPCI
jgi:NADPH2:quinone reductase